MNERLISVKNVSLSFPKHQVLTNLNFSLNRGEFLGVIGENGVGKTTLVKLILNQLHPTTGQVVMATNLKIGYVPQFRNIDIEYPLSVKDFIGLNFSGLHLPWLSKKEKHRITEVIDLVELQDIENRPLGLASGGEKQRAYLASALLNSPDVLILDESTASLDPDAKRELMAVVADLNHKLNVTILFVSHDLQLISEYPDHFLLLKKGGFETGSINELPVNKREEQNAEV